MKLFTNSHKELSACYKHYKNPVIASFTSPEQSKWKGLCVFKGELTGRAWTSEKAKIILKAFFSFGIAFCFKSFREETRILRSRNVDTFVYCKSLDKMRPTVDKWFNLKGTIPANNSAPIPPFPAPETKTNPSAPQSPTVTPVPSTSQAQPLNSTPEIKTNPSLLQSPTLPPPSPSIQVQPLPPLEKIGQARKTWDLACQEAEGKYSLDPFREAIDNENAQALIDLSSSPTYVFRAGFLNRAISQDKWKSFKTLLDLATTYPSRVAGNLTPLMQACKLGPKGERYIKALIDKKVDPCFRNSDKDDALTLAKASGVGAATLEKLEKWIKQQEIEETLLVSKPLWALNVALSFNDEKKISTRFQKFLDKGISLESGIGLNGTILLNCIKELGNESKNQAVLLEMIETLLKLGCDPNAPDKEGNTPLYYLIRNKPEGWEKLFLQMMEYGGDPLLLDNEGFSASFLSLKLPPSHPVRKKLEENTTFQFQNSLKNLSTIMGVLTLGGYQGKSTSSHGGNHNENIVNLFSDLLSEYLEADEQPLQVFQKNIALISRLMEPSPESLEEALQFSSHTPLMIPSGWPGHAIAMILFQNRLYVCNRGSRPKEVADTIGIQVYEVEMNREGFKSLIGFKSSDQALIAGKEALLPFIKNKLKGKLIQEVPYSDQKTGNCTWSNTAGLGLRCFLDLYSSKELLSKENRPSHKRFLHFSKYRTVAKAIKALQNCPQEADVTNGITFSSICRKSLTKIKEGKDPFGYHRQIVDLITYSGMPNYLMNETDELWPFYASLYGVADVQTFIKTLIDS